MSKRFDDFRTFQEENLHEIISDDYVNYVPHYEGHS